MFHHLLGATAFSLVLLHPVGVLFSYALVSIGLAIRTITPSWQNLAVFSGSLALLIFSVLLILTLFIKLPYDVWKKTHQYLGFGLLFAGVHGLLIGSTLALSLPLRIYIFGWVIFGLVSAVIRLFNVRIRFHQDDYTVTEVNVIRNWTIIKLKAEKKQMEYLPGQFVFVKFTSLGITSETHPFSLAGKISDDYLTIVIKSLGDYTETLKLLKSGATARVEGPYGRFNYSYGKFKKQIWIAGGIGITPFRGMAFEAFEKGLYEIYMYYVVNKPEEGLFDSEFLKLGQSNVNFRYKLWVGEDQGRITAEKTKSEVGDIQNCEIFICGPVAMMKSLTSQFKQLGVKNSRIHTEEFGLY